MEPILLFFAVVAAFCLGFALLALRQSGKHATAYREAQGALLEREGERAAALEAASRAERDLGMAQRDMRQAMERAVNAERDAAVVRQQMADLQARGQDFELHQQRMLEAAKAAVLQTGNEVSTKLLADHKQENAAAKKQAEEITARLFENFNSVTGRVEAMQRDGGLLQGQMDVVMRALTNPTGAGKISEVGLENLLKNFGLVAGRDFDMQYHMPNEAGGLRPDAMLYLPQNMVVVIDSKASKFIFELEEARSQGREAETLEKFRRTMRTQLQSLESKNYEAAYRENYRKAGRSGEIGSVLNVMYLHSEAAVELVRNQDDGSLQKSRIVLAGPAALHAICLLSRERIAEARRLENEHAIIEAVSELMEQVAIAVGYAGKMGEGIKKLNQEYARFVGSINGRMLSRMNRLGKLSVTPAKGREIPAKLPVYEMLTHEATIEHEAESEKVVSLIGG